MFADPSTQKEIYTKHGAVDVVFKKQETTKEIKDYRYSPPLPNYDYSGWVPCVVF